MAETAAPATPQATLTQETGSPNQEGKSLEASQREDTILGLFRKRLKESATHRTEWMEEAKALYDLAAGRQWDADDERIMKDGGRPLVTFNVSGKYLDALTGLQINNRQDIRYAAREPGDVRVNEQLTAAVGWGRDLSGMADDETDSFYDATLVGEGWVEGMISRDLDSNGAAVPCGERVDPLEMFPDPVSRKRNYEDARYVIRLKWISQEDYDELTKEVPDAGGEGEHDLAASLSDDGTQGLQFIETPHDYGDGVKSAASKKLRPLADYQWWEREETVRVTSPLGPQTFSAKSWPVMKAQMGQQGIPFKETPYRKKIFYRAIIAGGAVLKEGLNPNQEGFTFHAITGKRDRNKRRWYGIGKALVDPQKWVNKFFSSILYTLMTNAKGGIMAEEGAFVDQQKAEDTWSSADSIVMLKAGAVSGDKVKEKPQAEYPTGMHQLMEFSLNALPQTSGLNLELLGLADRVQAGVVEAQRKQSAMAIVAWAFDGMRRYYRSMGRMLANYVKDYMEEGTLIQIVGTAGKQYAPLVKQQLSVAFDVIVDEAPTSVNQQERVWAVLENLIPQLLKAGMQIPPKVIEYSPLPQDLKDEWAKIMQPDPNKQKINEETMANTLKKLVAEVSEIQAKAQLDGANAHLAEAKAKQVDAEVAAGPTPGLHPQQQVALESWKSRMQGMVQTHIAELKANRESETKVLIAQLDNRSKERVAALKDLIDAAVQSSVQGHLAPKIDKATATMTDLAKTMKRPRRIKKDAEGNPIGVELG